MPPEFSMHLAQASEWATEWQHLFYFLLSVSVFFSVLIFSLIFYFTIKYRRRYRDEVPPPTKDNLALEITWTVIPSALCVVMFVWASSLFMRNALPPAAASEIFVVAKQWMWQVQHPEGTRELNELHVPVGVPIKLTMASQDVIHDFGVPAFRIKKDVVPGHYTTEWFTATKTGRFHLFCDQYCGRSHSSMVGWIIVMTPADYSQWLSTSVVAGRSLADLGAGLYHRYGCDTCHETGKGPSLRGLYGSRVKVNSGQTIIADYAYIRDSILTPSAKIVTGYAPIMPTFQGQIGEEEVLQLTVYIRSLTQSPSVEREVVKR
jgi:cytochrome c oxidase subunit 2